MVPRICGNDRATGRVDLRSCESFSDGDRAVRLDMARNQRRKRGGVKCRNSLARVARSETRKPVAAGNTYLVGRRRGKRNSIIRHRIVVDALR